MVVKRKVRKTRKTKGGWFGIKVRSPIAKSKPSAYRFNPPGYKETREAKHQRIIDERRERAQINAEKLAQKREAEIAESRERARVYDASTTEYRALARKRKAASEARQLHPLRRALTKLFPSNTKPKRRISGIRRRSKIKWI